MARASHPLRDTFIPLGLLAGDTMVTFGGLALGWWLRYASPLGRLGIDVPDAVFERYLPLLLIGVALLIGAFAQFGLYDSRLLLRRYQSLNAILKGCALWLAIYLGISLALKFEPPISRLFAIFAFACVILLLHLWRTFAYTVLTRTPLLRCLQRRAVLLGWSDDASSLTAEIAHHPAHPLTIVGLVSLPSESAPPFAGSTGTGQPHVRRLGNLEALEEILAAEKPDLLIATRLDLPRPEIRRIVAICERRYVDWKIVPGAFDIFVSGLRLQTIGRVPVLGVDELAINRLFSRILKRALDVVGALVGLVLSAPVILLCAAAIKRASPGGPALFRQQRIGANHRPFTLYKLRSMAPEAEASDAAHQSTTPDDPRVLPLGRLLRRWNLDELPQFWNVLRGDMSLVGPRPERPYHVDQLAHHIAHYLPRHLVKPGLTGWAQVNGLRGDTDLSARIQHDIYYIENWSIWLDVQILALTFVRWRDRR